MSEETTVVPAENTPEAVVFKYVANGQSYPITVPAGTTFETFVNQLSSRHPELVANQSTRTITRAGQYAASLIDYQANAVHPSFVLQSGDIIVTSGKVQAGA